MSKGDDEGMFLTLTKLAFPLTRNRPNQIENWPMTHEVAQSDLEEISKLVESIPFPLMTCMITSFMY